MPGMVVAPQPPIVGMMLITLARLPMPLTVARRSRAAVKRCSLIGSGTNSRTPSAIASIKVDALELNSDIHGSAEYRANLVSVMAKRAVAAAMR